MWEKQNTPQEVALVIQIMASQNMARRLYLENTRLKRKVKLLQTWATFIYILALWLLICICYLVWSWPR